MVSDIVGELLCHVEIALCQIHLQTGQRPRRTGIVVRQRHDRIRIMFHYTIACFQRPEVAQLIGFGFRLTVFDHREPVRRPAAIDMMRLPNALGVKRLCPLAKGEGQVIRQVSVWHSLKQRRAGGDPSPHFRFVLCCRQQAFVPAFDPGTIQLPAQVFHVFGASIRDQRRCHLFAAEIEQMHLRAVARRTIGWKHHRQILPVEIGHLRHPPGIFA